MKKLISLFLIGIFLISCSSPKRKADLKGIDFDVKIQRFDRDFWALKESKNLSKDLQKLYAKYPDFAPIYFGNIVLFGRNKEEVLAVLPDFFADTTANKLCKDALEKFSDVSKIEKSLTKAFQKGQYFFSQTPVPQCIMHISLLNQSVVVADRLISVGIDKYLGEDYPLYELSPEFYPYLRKNMKPEKVVSDYVHVWLLTEFPYFSEQDKLLDKMIYDGKILYVTSLLLSDEKAENLIGYTAEQWKFCKNYEKDMWQTLIQEKYLFSYDFMLRKKILENAPFTQPFTQESPGRAGQYIGWQIVESYMKKNPEITPLQLMQNADAQEILENSGYNP
ncbi:MAG: hypothetical protein LBS50_11965 [Prevotellaceae bacterium]|jgi:uncharacterized protein YjaZ|nr:hypothetical protein [Prevotellaceae bacterium]